MQSQEVIAGGRYMAGGDTEAVFAPGSVADNMSLEVTWMSGKRSIVTGVKANRAYESRRRPPGIWHHLPNRTRNRFLRMSAA